MDNRARFSADGLLWQTVFEMHRDVVIKNKLLQNWRWVKEALFMRKNGLWVTESADISGRDVSGLPYLFGGENGFPF